VKLVAGAALLYSDKQRRSAAFRTSRLHNSIGMADHVRKLYFHADSPTSLYFTSAVSEYRQAMHSNVRLSWPASLAGSM
jgi:hypothetical protein